jgi:hypothetical protein
MDKMVFESEEPITLTSEDSGCAMLVDEGEPYFVGDDDAAMWVRLGSWDDNGYKNPEISHTQIKKLVGKRVRVTLEVIE